MKRLLPIAFILAATSAAGATSQVPSAQYPYEMISCISANGQWAVGNLENNFTAFIRNLVTGQVWNYDEYDGETDKGTKYGIALDQAVSDGGVVVGFVDDLPAYWENGTWHLLPVLNFNGRVQIGSISRDGSMIVGALGRDTGEVLDDVQFTSPCLWRRGADGKFGNPEFLPQPKRDITNAIPQYFTLISVSDDCKTIGAQMTCNYGFPHICYAYTQGADGDWTYTLLGESLLNPKGVEFPEYVGEYKGPEAPNYELYLTEEEYAEFELEFPAWADEMEFEGYTDEDIELLRYRFVAQFIQDEKKKAEYEALLDAYYDAFFEWYEQYMEYEVALGALFVEGHDFVFNNLRISPDGTKIYSTAVKQERVDTGDPENPFQAHYAPAIFNVATGEGRVLSDKHNVLLSSVTADGSVLGAEYQLDHYLNRFAYIFPQGQNESVNMLEYFTQEGNLEALKWMDQNLFHDVMIMGDYGLEPFETYSMGIPYTTPDMSLMAFKVSTLYWVDEEKYDWITYLLNTGMDTGVDGVEADSVLSVAPKPGAVVSVGGVAESLRIFDLTGRTVFSTRNASGNIATGLSSGIYLIEARSASGSFVTRKVAL